MTWAWALVLLLSGAFLSDADLSDESFANLHPKVSFEDSKAKCGHHTRVGRRDAEATAFLPGDFRAVDSQALLTEVLRQTKDSHLFSGYQLANRAIGPGAVQPIWWSSIFDDAHTVLDCGNGGTQQNLGCRPSGAAPFDMLDNITTATGGAVLAIVRCDMCQLLRGWAVHKHAVKTKIVLIGDMDQDFGALSRGNGFLPSDGRMLFADVLRRHCVGLGARSSDIIGDVEDRHGDPCGTVESRLGSLLRDERLVLWVTAQHTFTADPKIISLPLGVNSPRSLSTYARRLRGKPRTRLVGDACTSAAPQNDVRERIKDAVTAALPHNSVCPIPSIPKDFRPELQTTHKPTKLQRLSRDIQMDQWHVRRQLWYWTFTADSMFVLSPPGTGFDCYRTWEALALGAVPIKLRSTFDRTFAGLPVLLLDSINDVNASMLHAHYLEFVKNAAGWDFTRLTPEYWRNMLRHVVRTGSSEIVQRNHPIPRHYEGEFVRSWPDLKLRRGPYRAGENNYWS